MCFIQPSSMVSLVKARREHSIYTPMVMPGFMQWTVTSFLPSESGSSGSCHEENHSCYSQALTPREITWLPPTLQLKCWGRVSHEPRVHQLYFCSLRLLKGMYSVSHFPKFTEGMNEILHVLILPNVENVGERKINRYILVGLWVFLLWQTNIFTVQLNCYKINLINIY